MPNPVPVITISVFKTGLAFVGEMLLNLGILLKVKVKLLAEVLVIDYTVPKET